MTRAHKRIIPQLILLASLACNFTAIAQTPPGWAPPWLDYWTFDDTNSWTSTYKYPAASFTNIGTSLLGDYYVAIVDNTNGPAWLNYNITEPSGTNHFKIDQGSVMFWFAPNWSSVDQGGNGPGEWSRLIEVGSYTTNASYGWFSLYLDPFGTNIYFSSQTNDGSGGTYLSYPISWNVTNLWHLIALTYSQTNTTLYLDDFPVTNGLPLAYWPGPDVLTNGFFVGSNAQGTNQAHGMFDDMSTYDHELSQEEVDLEWWWDSTAFFGNPMNFANIVSAPSEPAPPPVYRAITGTGFMTNVTSAATCTTGGSIWITNVTAVTSNQTVTLTFTVQGGSSGVLYDAFANTILDLSASTNHPWAWLGQVTNCATYTLTNLPTGAFFVILGTPQDSDADGLTDAYELLVSKTSPTNPDSDGDGIPDGWAAVLSLNQFANDAAQSGSRLNYFYDLTDWLNTLSGAKAGSVTLDPEGNVLTVTQ